jgi:hypothetical protein
MSDVHEILGASIASRFLASHPQQPLCPAQVIVQPRNRAGSEQTMRQSINLCRDIFLD